MSKGSTPLPTSGSASPYTPLSSASATPKQNTSSKQQKPSNVFSNDGSFLERFQRLKKDEEDKKKQEEILQRKRNFDNRFKNRGKRPPPDSVDSSSTASVPTSPNESSPPPAKKPRSDEDDTRTDRSAGAPKQAISQYEKEMKVYAHKSLKDDGIGVRPLVK